MSCQSREPSAGNDGVVVQEDEDLAGGGSQALIVSRPEPGVVVVQDHLDVRNRSGEPLELLDRAVGRRIVDHDQLVVRVVRVLEHDWPDTFAKRPRLS